MVANKLGLLMWSTDKMHNERLADQLSAMEHRSHENPVLAAKGLMQYKWFGSNLKRAISFQDSILLREFDRNKRVDRDHRVEGPGAGGEGINWLIRAPLLYSLHIPRRYKTLHLSKIVLYTTIVVKLN